MKSTLQCLMLALSAVVGFGGCTIAFQPIPDAVVVSVPAPRAQVEIQTVAQSSDQIWIDGYWRWSGSQWLWVSGRWEYTRVGYYWVAPHSSYRGGQTYYAAGGWTQDKSYKTSNKKPAYNNGKGSNNSYNSSNNSYKNSNKGSKGSNKGYKASNQKCPKGYVWSKNACRSNSKPNKTVKPNKN